jgi:arylsulfatase A-like enzyme
MTKGYSRNRVAAAAFVAFVVGWGGCSKQEEAARGGGGVGGPKHNVLLVTLGSTRADRLGCYGGKGGLTPNLDGFAADVVRCDGAIAASSISPVALATIHTGLYPPRHGLRMQNGMAQTRVRKGCTVLAEVLKRAGYATGAFVGSLTASQKYGLDRGFETFWTGFDVERGAKEATGADGVVTVGEFQSRADAVTDAAIEWVGKQDGPFFAWVHYADAADDVLKPPDEALPAAAKDASSEGGKRALYDAEVKFVDAQFGRLLEALKAGGRYDKTIIVVAADHGYGLGEHGWWGAQALWQEQIHVPLILRIPGSATGAVINGQTLTADVAATVCAVLGLRGGESLDGMDLSLCVGRDKAMPRPAYAECLDRAGTAAPGERLYASVGGGWKLILRHPDIQASELYHLIDDAKEMNNRLGQDPEVESSLAAVILSVAGEADSLALGGPDDADTVGRLKELGYVSGAGARGESETKPAEAKEDVGVPTTQRP